ncbi:TIM barrel protein [Pseudooceanicola sp. LIPI14-2-Ac024]|uniref:TIM barrel protein n=1 Tax=Pseudooceanicola sp. LIPI14-2-Ac024 TaxID=3344875 RepID=UPI0035D0C50B
MNIRATIACGPTCWGVDDASWPNLPVWERVLDETAEAGLGGLELGPYGYFPLDLEITGKALADRGLCIVAGTIFADLVSPANREALLHQADEICDFITALPQPETHAGQRYSAPYLTVMDFGHPERDVTAGHSDHAPRLDDGQWAGMLGNIRAIAELARDRYAVRATIHPHAGGYIEFADDIARLVRDIDADTAGLCLDTGHLTYAGMDPAAVLERYWDRVDYIHFKDIDFDVYGQVMSRPMLFFEACANGVMCPIGHGGIDYDAIHDLLSRKGYGGYITIEQDRDPSDAGATLGDLIASRDFLRQSGF